jgi:NADH:ubiquinone oxidoreductase subunit 5 (subunit L)/multisubunit Na+/H+ antiporter MnhA subunit
LIQAIVFLPLLAAIVAGLGNRVIGNLAAKLITTGALFVSCILSWPIFIGFMTEAWSPRSIRCWTGSIRATCASIGRSASMR